MKLRKLIVVVLTALALSMASLPASATTCEEECYQEYYDCVVDFCFLNYYNPMNPHIYFLCIADGMNNGNQICLGPYGQCVDECS